MTNKQKLLFHTAGPVWAGCLHFILESGALYLPPRISLIPAFLTIFPETVLAASGLGRWPVFPATAVL